MNEIDHRAEQIAYLQHCVSENLNHARHVENERLTFTSIYIAMVIGAVGRAFSATLAGILYWDTAPWASLVYNGTYLIPDTIICMVLAVFIAKPVMKVLKAK